MLDTTLDALLLAILADPDDDAPRLIYADALDEAGASDKAEFIRRQVRVAAPWSRDTGECWQCNCVRRRTQHTNGKCRCTPAWKALRRRERELWLDNRHAWGDLPGPVGEAADEFGRWRRGFVAEARSTPRDWIRHGPDVVRKHPVERLDLGLPGGPNVPDIPPDIYRIWRAMRPGPRESIWPALAEAALTYARREAFPCGACGGKGDRHAYAGDRRGMPAYAVSACPACEGLGWRVGR